MTDVNLGNDARFLIEATRDAYDPTTRNQATVRWRVERALSSARSGSELRPRRFAMSLAAGAGILAGAGVAAALAWQGLSSTSADDAPAAESSLALPVEAELAERRAASADQNRGEARLGGQVTEAVGGPEASEASPPSVATRSGVSAAPRKGSLPRASDLAAETVLIAEAQAATNRGQGERALELLAEYDRQFARGALTEERAAARVLALCAAGDRDAARAEAERFLARWPRSPQAGRMRQACRAESPSP